MKKRIFIVSMLVLMLVGVIGVSAQQNIFAAYNKPGTVNLNVMAGYGYWLGVGAEAEFIVGKFDIGPMPFQWGLMAAGLVDIPWIDVGVGAMATLHTGLIWGLDLFLGLGVGFDFYGGFWVSAAQTAGVAYKLSDSLTVMGIDTWLAGASCYGVGIQLKL